MNDIISNQESDLKIGLTFSGGGYRASSFCIGALTYLDRIDFQGASLLDKVHVLSTVSGGTITGIRYTQGLKRGESLDEIFEDLCSFMRDVDLLSSSLENLASKERWTGERIASLINAIADVYEERLFKGGTFGDLLSTEKPIHLKHFSFNAVDFRNALQFRFQQSETLLDPKENEPPKGIIGNYYLRIPEVVARDIRLADILAASTCFPGGFEPINFPGDFGLPDSEELRTYLKNTGDSVGLMDGGMVDNQGIEPVLLANTRMKRNLKATDPAYNVADNALDLILICDVSSPYMEEYEAADQKELNWWRKLTPKKINITLVFIALIGLILTAGSITLNNTVLIVAFTILTTFGVTGLLLFRYMLSLPGRFNVPQFFLKPLGNLLKLRLLVYETMIMNRANSLLKMANDVFTKHIRRLNYRLIWDEVKWKNRRIMNAVYELRPGERKLKEKIDNNRISTRLVPSDKVQHVANKAAEMKTSLWFTKDELKPHDKLDSLIACGQFNTCWNLLEYIEKIEQDDTNTSLTHNELIRCKTLLFDHWEQFQEDPFWLLDEITTRINLKNYGINK